MATAESQRKIRQLAIVLANIDPSVVSRILGSIPQDVRVAIRHQQQKLGAVSTTERKAAFEALRPILKAFAVDQRVAPTPQAPPANSRSPAEQLADGYQQQDFADIGYGALGTASTDQTPVATQPETTNALGIDWHHASGKVWAELLQSERPILIATVLAHAPQSLACEVLQALPSHVALDTLASMPKIGVTELAILKEIAAQLNARLQIAGERSAAGGWGLQRAKGIVESLPLDMRKLWVKQLEQIDGSVARELSAIAFDDATDEVIASLPIGKMASTEKPAIKIAEHTLRPEQLTATYTVSATAELNQAGESANDVVAYDAEDFESLLQLSRANLARVIRQCKPDVVLMALSGASRKWVARFEAMMHPKEISRLRSRLDALSNRPIKEVDEAQARIVSAAVSLGVIDAPRDVMAA